MSAAFNPLGRLPLEVPNPPEKFGEDGGKFYHCYDEFAKEIDDDMTQGLKEQLDGMLIFAGLFAGVNTAFLALTLPLLSADSADDTNALLNAILAQLSSGRNDSSTPTNSILPSATFSPTHDIYTINVLFSLSLTFAIISSFLAVLGRQWLVYYRKRGGNGPDRQRWEQLQRFMGAARWRLELILDDVLPFLLQIGLIIFCASLIIYLRHLSPEISLIVGIPMYAGLGFFVGSALCTLWDRFCPFQSPLSHILGHFVPILPSLTIIPIVRIIRSIFDWLFNGGQRWYRLQYTVQWYLQDIQYRMLTILNYMLTIPDGISSLTRRRKDLSAQQLQALAVRRVICTSDDPLTVLNALANLLTINDIHAYDTILAEENFVSRMCELARGSRINGPQAPAADARGFAESSRRLHYYALVHLHLARTWDLRERQYWNEMRSFRLEEEISIPYFELTQSSTTFLKTHLISVLYCHDPKRDQEKLLDYLVQLAQTGRTRSDPQFWGMFLILIWNHLSFTNQVGHDSLRELYYLHSFEQAEVKVDAAFSMLFLLDNSILTSLAGGLIRILNESNGPPKSHMKFYFSVLTGYEQGLRSRIPEEAAREGRMLRENLLKMLISKFCITWDDATSGIKAHEHGLGILNSYLRRVLVLHSTEDTYHDEAEVASLVSHSLKNSLHGESITTSWEELLNTLEPLNEIALDARRKSYQIHRSARCVRDPEERWCHHQEEPLVLETYEIKGPLEYFWGGRYHTFQMLLPSTPRVEHNDDSGYDGPPPNRLSETTETCSRLESMTSCSDPFVT